MERINDLEKKLYEMGYQCGKMAEDIVKISDGKLEDVLMVVPLRGGRPIATGIIAAISELYGPKELDVLYVPASSVVKERYELISKLIEKIFKKKSSKRDPPYKLVIVVDEAISGASSKMVLDAVKKGIKNYREEKEWKRNYWKKIPTYLFVMAAYNGTRFDPRIRKKSNVLVYTVDGKLPTIDNKQIYEERYISVVGRVKSRSGIVYPVVEPDVLFEKNENWRYVVKNILKGVKGYVEDKRRLDKEYENYEDISLAME